MWIVKLSFILLNLCFAKEPSDGKLHVVPLDGDPAWSKMKDKSTVIEKPQASEIPSPNLRDESLESCGVGHLFVDHFEKDMFYLRAKNYKSGKLRSFYPKISAKVLEKCQRKIKYNL